VVDLDAALGQQPAADLLGLRQRVPVGDRFLDQVPDDGDGGGVAFAVSGRT